MEKEKNYLEDSFSEEELGIEKEDHSIYPIDRDKIQVVVNNTSIFSLISLVKRGDIQLQPNFQRSYVWNDEKAEKFIDSIWNGLPIPQLFLLTKRDGKQLVIDGQQRLTSLIRFILSKEELGKILPDTSFGDFHGVDQIKLKVSKGIFTGEVSNREEKICFSDLNDDTKRKFEGESLIIANIKPTYSLFKDNEDDLENMSKEIFYRLNTGGVSLTSQEIRHSLYHKKFMIKIKEISFSDKWKNLIPTGIQKIKNDPSLLSEMLLRSFALLDTYAEDYEGDTIGSILNGDNKFEYFKPLNLFLDKYASLSDKFTEKEINDRINILNNLLDKLNEIFKDESLFKHQNVQNLQTRKPRPNSFNIKYVDTLFVALLNLFRFNTDINLEVLETKIKEFKSNSEFIENHISKPGSSDPTYVAERVLESIEFFNKLK